MSTIWELVKQRRRTLTDVEELIGEDEIYIGETGKRPIGIRIPENYWIMLLNGYFSIWRIGQVISHIRMLRHLQLVESDGRVRIACGRFEHPLDTGEEGYIYGANVVQILEHEFELVPERLTAPMPRVKYGDLITPVLVDPHVPEYIIYSRIYWVATLDRSTKTLGIFPHMLGLVQFARRAPFVEPCYVSDDFNEPTIFVGSMYNVYPQYYSNFGRLLAAIRCDEQPPRRPIYPFDGNHHIVLRETGDIVASFANAEEHSTLLSVIEWLNGYVSPMPTKYEYTADAACMPCLPVGPFDVYSPDGTFGNLKHMLEKQ